VHRNILPVVLTALSATFLLAGCGASIRSAAYTGNNVERPVGWTEETHGNDTEPDYEVVFPQDEVNQLTITINPEDWEVMQANMVELYGEKGTGTFRPDDFPAGNFLPENKNFHDSGNISPPRAPGQGGFFPGGEEE
jgi:hypothetical protein